MITLVITVITVRFGRLQQIEIWQNGEVPTPRDSADESISPISPKMKGTHAIETHLYQSPCSPSKMRILCPNNEMLWLMHMLDGTITNS